MADLEGFEEQHPLNSRAREARRRGSSKRSTASAASTTTRFARIVGAPARRGCRSRRRRSRTALSALITLVRDRRRRRSRGVRHRLGAEPRLRRGHDERLHRGLHGRARHEGRVGRRRLLRRITRRPRRSSALADARAVVRGSPAGRSAATASRRCRASRRRRSKWSSKPATPARSRRSASTCRTISASASSTAASRCRCRTCSTPTSARCPTASARSSAWDDAEVERAQAVGRVCQRADDRDSRGARARLGPHGRSASTAQPQELLKEQYSALEEIARRSGRAVFRRRSVSGRRSACVPADEQQADRAAPSTKPTRATRWCSCGASARARSSKKTTCAIARRSCTG